jgi:hypothetical protein
VVAPPLGGVLIRVSSQATAQETAAAFVVSWPPPGLKPEGPPWTTNVPK